MRDITPSAPPSPAWFRLTKDAHKLALYRLEAQLWEAWCDARETWGTEAESMLSTIGVVVFKPETVARGMLRPGIEFLTRNGLTPVAVREVQLSRTTSHWIWRYQWNKATVDRVRLHQCIHDRTPSLLVVVRGSPDDSLPASVRMSELKGPTDAARRLSGHFRTIVGMTNRMIGFLHCPDEPIDVIRELGVLFDEPERRALLDELTDVAGLDRTAEVRAAAAQLEARTIRHSVDPTEVTGRLARDPGGRGELARAVAAGERLSLEDIFGRFGAPASEHARWDLCVLASELILHDRPDVRAVIDAVDRPAVNAGWTADVAVSSALLARQTTAESDADAADEAGSGQGQQEQMWGSRSMWLGVYDALSAKVADEANAGGMWLSSYCVSAALKSTPDAEYITATEMMAVARSIGLAVPGAGIVVDCDTGFGDAAVFAEVVHAFAATTLASGVCIEDKVHPKRNSFYRPDLHTLEDPEVFARKIAAGLAASRRYGPHLKIIARTEALVAGQSAEEALRRLRIYREAGADAVLLQARDRLGDFLRVAQEWSETAPDCPLICAPTAFPDLSAADLWSNGFSIVIQANQLLRAAVRTQQRLGKDLLDPLAPLGNVADELVSMRQLDELVGAASLNNDDHETVVP